MKFTPADIDKLIVPAGMLVSGVILGFIIERILLLNVKRMAIRARWEGGRVIINALRGMPFLWCAIAGVYGAVLNSELTGERLFSYIKMGMAVIVIFSVTVVISKLSTGFVKLYTGRILPSTTIFANLTKIFVYVMGMLVLLQTIGISVAPIITALGVGGLAVALALQDTLTNLFAGLHVIASKKMKPGDYIKLETGGEGVLEDITWRNTSIRTLTNNTIIVPNSKMASSIVTNFSIPSKELDFQVQAGVSYESDLEQVQKVSEEVAMEVLKSFFPEDPVNPPAIRYTEFGNSSINFLVIFRVKEFTDQGKVKHEFIKRLYQRFKEEGIEIPFPTQTVYLHKAE